MGVELARGRKAAAAEAEPIEGPWELPEGWRWERISEVSCEPERGAPISRFPDTFRYLDVSSIDGARISPKIIPSSDAPSRARQFVQPGDTVLSGVRVYLRNLTIVTQDTVDVASTAFCVLRPKENIDHRFMHLWISSDWFINALMPLQRGNSPPAVLDADVRAQAIPVPPLDVQRKLASRIDALFAEVDEGEAALAEARAGVETYRKALLKAAVTGELTADWRQANPPQETGEQLLQRILSDRRTRWHADSKNARKKYTEPAGPDTDGLPQLPEGWAWVNLDQLSTHEVRNGLSVKDTSEPTEVRALRLGALSGNEVDWSVFRYLPRTLASVEGYRLQDGDLLVSRANGSPELVGKASLCTTPPADMIFPDTAIRFRLLGGTELRQWIVRVWNSLLVRHQIARLAKTTAGILKISQGDISCIAVPIPPPIEMNTASRLVEEGLSMAAHDDLLHQIGGAASTLRQSILAAAFRGELAA